MTNSLPSRTVRVAAVAAVALTLAALPARASMEKLINQGTTILQTFDDVGPKIPARVMANAKGVV